MTPEHHLPDHMLVEYASGAADPADAILVASHLTLCARCRHDLVELETVGAAVMGQGGADSVAPDHGDGEIESIVARALAASTTDGGGLPAGDGDESGTAHGDGVLPGPLIRHTGPLDQIAWRCPLPGVEVLPVHIEGSTREVRLVRVKPNALVGHHDHGGLEVDLVLAGGLRDLSRGGTFERGDIQSAEPGERHALRTLPDGPCIVFTVNAGPIRPRGLWSRIVYGWLGWS